MFLNREKNYSAIGRLSHGNQFIIAQAKYMDELKFIAFLSEFGFIISNLGNELQHPIINQVISKIHNTVTITQQHKISLNHE